MGTMQNPGKSAMAAVKGKNASGSSPKLHSYEHYRERADHHSSRADRHQTVSEHHYAHENDELGMHHREAGEKHLLAHALYMKACQSTSAVSASADRHASNYGARGDDAAREAEAHEKEHELKLDADDE